jgi:DNA repair exonuclease SbcCD ATPase subunit
MNQLAERTPVLIATEINSIKEQTRKMFLFNSIEIGRRLVEAKQMVPHGEWGLWLQESVDYSQSTANHLMKIFEQYGADQLTLFGDNAKSQALGKLSYTQAVALLGIPYYERENFINENDVENMSTRELQQAIKEKQEMAKKLKEAEKKAKEEQQAKEKIEKELKKLELQSKDHTLIVDKLKADLEAANVSGDDKEVERLRQTLTDKESELKESNGKIKSLERQLKEKPIDVPEIIEKVPEDVEKELAELRGKVASQSNDKAVSKFQFVFEGLVSEFKELLSVLNQIEDPGVKEKYKVAVKGLIGKMEERI